MSASSSRARPFVVGELLLVAFLLFGYDRIASVANEHSSDAFRHGWLVLRVERILHIAVELPFNQLLAPHRLLGQVLAVYYDFGHGFVTFGVLMALYVFRAELYRPARSALMLINAVALVVFLVVPVAPPRLLNGSGFIDVVANSGTWGAWETGNSSLSEHADKFASVPSLHVAYALWVLRSVLAASSSRVLRTLAGTHLAITAAVVIVTGNHYIVDVVAGAALAESAWWAARGASMSFDVLRRLAAAEPARQRALSARLAERQAD
jgi:diacylglycerol O-acyltransferase